jgi:hypothetical protein
MQVFNQEFVDAVKVQLAKVQPGFYITREQVCLAVEVSGAYANAISILMAGPEFAGYESVKSRGIRPKKIEVSPEGMKI